MRVLIVAAHPDDEVLGVGGTALAHAQRGDCVKAAILCEGVSARYAAERQAEVVNQSRRVAEILGFSELVLRQLPDQRLDTLPLSEVIREVEALVTDFCPEIVYTHFGGDLNRDHRLLSEAVLVATRPYSAPSVREVLMFETPSSTEWNSPHITPAFQPSVYVDIGAFLDAKIEAICCYSHEVRESPHPRSPPALRARAQHWGSVVNRQAAEVFVLARSVR